MNIYQLDHHIVILDDDDTIVSILKPKTQDQLTRWADNLVAYAHAVEETTAISTFTDAAFTGLQTQKTLSTALLVSLAAMHGVTIRGPYSGRWTLETGFIANKELI